MSTSSSVMPRRASCATCFTVSRSIIIFLFYSPANMKAAQMLCWQPPLCMYLADLGCGWSFPQECEQALKSRASSLSQYFHTAITMVAGISTQTKREGFVHDKVAEADSL